jgi:Cd2+/Zn2+-exporting ATPase
MPRRPGLTPHVSDTQHNDDPAWQLLLGSAVVCGVATLAGVICHRGGHDVAAHGAYATAYLAGGWDAALDTLGKLRRWRVDIHFLMLAVAAGAASIGAWWEGGTLLFLFSLSNALEAMASERTEREIKSLFRDAPKRATVLRADGTERTVPADELAPGDLVRVRPGEQFPADAAVLTGETAADEAALTGEAEPVDKRPGSEVFGGTLNTWGSVDARVTRPPAESAHARIMRLIREAQQSKAPSQRFTDRFGTGYAIGILALTLVMFLVWHYALGVPAFLAPEGASSAFYRAMTLLVVCSPCALVISIPSAILAGIAAGARDGILFRGGVALENLAEIDRLAFDKTGTLTKGEAEIVRIEPAPGADEAIMLRFAASLAHHSAHPLSRAIVAACKEHTCNAIPAADFESLAGHGLRGVVDGLPVTLGRRSLFPDHPWVTGLPDPAPGLSEVIIVANKETAGRILLRDAPRPEAAGLIRELRGRKLKLTMLTGDREESARLLAGELGIDDFRAGLHPEDKVAAVRAWRAAGERVAMVGDGINDAPSLAAADVSIGMGLRGSDAVLEQADVILTKDRLDRVCSALRLSRRCRAVIRQNLAVSLGVVILLGLAALGSMIPLPLGVLGHEGSTVIVVLNSLRLLLR